MNVLDLAEVIIIMSIIDDSWCQWHFVVVGNDATVSAATVTADVDDIDENDDFTCAGAGAIMNMMMMIMMTMMIGMLMMMTGMLMMMTKMMMILRAFFYSKCSTSSF